MHRRHWCLAALGWHFPASAVQAAMGSPLPTHIEQVFRLNESPLLRLQAISFFTVGLLLCAAAVR
jgi:hypothetical protein